jgi:hypothetical protein
MIQIMLEAFFIVTGGVICYAAGFTLIDERTKEGLALQSVGIGIACASMWLGYSAWMVYG